MYLFVCLSVCLFVTVCACNSKTQSRILCLQIDTQATATLMTTAAEKSPEALQIACELPAPQAIRDLVVVDKSDQIETTQGKGICQAELESSSITMSLTG